MAIAFQVTFDADDPGALAAFWREALGYVDQPPPEGFPSWEAWMDSVGIPPEHRNDAAALVDPEGVGPRLFFQRVPEGKTAKNRVHLDVHAGAPEHSRERVDAHVEHLVRHGGAVVAEREERGERWVVMRDPEGNELCVQ